MAYFMSLFPHACSFKSLTWFEIITFISGIFYAIIPNACPFKSDKLIRNNKHLLVTYFGFLILQNNIRISFYVLVRVIENNVFNAQYAEVLIFYPFRKFDIYFRKYFKIIIHLNLFGILVCLDSPITNQIFIGSIIFKIFFDCDIIWIFLILIESSHTVLSIVKYTHTNLCV